MNQDISLAIFAQQSCYVLPETNTYADVPRSNVLLKEGNEDEKKTNCI